MCESADKLISASLRFGNQFFSTFTHSQNATAVLELRNILKIQQKNSHNWQNVSKRSDFFGFFFSECSPEFGLLVLNCGSFVRTLKKLSLAETQFSITILKNFLEDKKCNKY